MKIIMAVDSFKGSLSSMQAGQAAMEGVKRVYSDAEIVIRPVADGGEGTVEALVEGLKGAKYAVDVTGPLGRPVKAEYGIIERDTAVIEMSAAAGITLVPENERNPLNTTTYGVGEIILDAVKKGCRNFVVGIGGSATNDGGIGMLQALGYGMLDKNGNQVSFGARGLSELREITDENVSPELEKCIFNIACDVTNPLCGENGCSAVYGPQKGADPDMVEEMDKWLLNYARLTENRNHNADKNIQGAGAAGGMGFAFLSFLNGTLKNGIEMILEETGFEKFVKGADFVITGEGRLDAQTAMGKVPSGVAKAAKKHNIPVIAFAGCIAGESNACSDCGIDAYFPILRSVCTLEEAMNGKNAYKNMADTVEQVFRLVRLTSV